MKIDKETVRKIAHLARIEITPEEEDEMVRKLDNTIEWIGKLNEIDVTGIEPLIHMTEEVNVMREDVVQPPLDHKTALNLAPEHNSSYYIVPKVMES